MNGTIGPENSPPRRAPARNVLDESVSRGGAAGSRSAATVRVLSAVVFAGLVAVVPLSSLPYGSVEPFWTALFEASVFLFAALWAVEGALTGLCGVCVHSLVEFGLHVPSNAFAARALAAAATARVGGRTI